ncbi:MAG: hypothetical protein AB7Q17_05115 [Phycisphaerae bacterium]
MDGASTPWAQARNAIRVGCTARLFVREGAAPLPDAGLSVVAGSGLLIERNLVVGVRVMRGDFNCEGLVNNLDSDPFVPGARG